MTKLSTLVPSDLHTIFSQMMHSISGANPQMFYKSMVALSRHQNLILGDNRVKEVLNDRIVDGFLFLLQNDFLTAKHLPHQNIDKIKRLPIAQIVADKELVRENIILYALHCVLEHRLINKVITPDLLSTLLRHACGIEGGNIDAVRYLIHSKNLSCKAQKALDGSLFCHAYHNLHVME